MINSFILIAGEVRQHILNFILFGIILGIVAVQASASEIDSFTRRNEYLPDLTDALNQEVMRRLEEAVKQSNRQSDHWYMNGNYPLQGVEGVDYCNPEHLYAQLRKQFAGPLIGRMESYINHLPKSLRRELPLEDSIYKDFLFKETPALATIKNMGSLIRMGDYLVGSDKFGHFFTEGWSYFKIAYIEGLGVEEALLFGEMTESLYYGAMFTGIYSYADLVANFNGMRFWNAILGEQDDPLSPEQKPQPYVCCINTRWEITRQFDWREYIDAAWDEGINYNLFRNSNLLSKVRSRIESLGKNNRETCDCLENPKEVTYQLTGKYQDYMDRLLNLKGFDILLPKLHAQNLLDRYYQKKEGHERPDWQKWVFEIVERKVEEWEDIP